MKTRKGAPVKSAKKADKRAFAEPHEASGSFSPMWKVLLIVGTGFAIWAAFSKTSPAEIILSSTTTSDSIDFSVIGEDDAKWLAFEEWLLDNNVRSSSSLQLFKRRASLDGLRPTGVRSIASVKEGDHILKVPKSLAITANVALKTPLEPVFRHYGWVGEQNELFALTVLLLYLRFSAPNFWTPYIDVLPKNVTSLLDYDEDEIAAFNDPKLTYLWNDLRKQVKRLYRKGFSPVFDDYPDLFSRDVHTPEAFRWAFLTVRANSVALFPTRLQGGSFGVDPTAQRVTAMVPVLDSFYHSLPTTSYMPASYGIAQNKDEITVWTLSVHPPGREVFTSYGDLDNADLMVQYGILSHDNPLGGPAVSVALLEHEVPNANAIFQKLSLTRPVEGHLLATGPDDKLMMAMRWNSLTPSELSRADKIAKTISPRNEMAAMKEIMHIIRAKENTYINTIEQDRDLLTDKALSKGMRAAVEYRIAQRKALSACFLAVQKFLDENE